MLAAGYQVADVLQRVNMARADSARLQKGADLTATLIARVNTLKATASPEEAATLEAELPHLQQGQKDLQAGIDHLNSFAHEGEGLVGDTRNGVAEGQEMQAVTATNPQSDLPSTSQLSVLKKLDTYLLNPDHSIGAAKAKWFQAALGFTRGNEQQLADQIVFNEAQAVPTTLTQWGQKFNQTISIVGANGKTIDVVFGWIKNNDGVVRLTTAIPTKL